MDDDDAEIHLVGDVGLAVAVTDRTVYVGSGRTNVLSSYNWEMESEGVVGPRLTADFSALVAAPEGGTVVAGCDDFAVKVINTANFSLANLEGHTAPVLSVDLACQGDVVASSSCDGSVKVNTEVMKKD